MKKYCNSIEENKQNRKGRSFGWNFEGRRFRYFTLSWLLCLFDINIQISNWSIKERNDVKNLDFSQPPALLQHTCMILPDSGIPCDTVPACP